MFHRLSFLAGVLSCARLVHETGDWVPFSQHFNLSKPRPRVQRATGPRLLHDSPQPTDSNPRPRGRWSSALTTRLSRHLYHTVVLAGRGHCVEHRSTWHQKSFRVEATAKPSTGGRSASSSMKCLSGNWLTSLLVLLVATQTFVELLLVRTTCDSHTSNSSGKN